MRTPNPEVCDATDDDRKAKAGIIQKLKNTNAQQHCYGYFEFPKTG